MLVWFDQVLCKNISSWCTVSEMTWTGVFGDCNLKSQECSWWIIIIALYFSSEITTRAVKHPAFIYLSKSSALFSMTIIGRDTLLSSLVRCCWGTTKPHGSATLAVLLSGTLSSNHRGKLGIFMMICPSVFPLWAFILKFSISCLAWSC